MIQAASPPVVEPGLGEILAEVVGAARLRSTVSAQTAVSNTEVALICVGTPGRANGRIDTRAIERVATGIGQALRGRAEPFAVVLRSTVLPGTTERVLIPALCEATGGRCRAPVRIGVNPEFMREGCSLRDFAHPPLTLVGSEDPEVGSLLRSLYAGVEAPFVQTTVRTAEMAKYVANAFHALKICFANEIADVSAALGVDARTVMQVFLMDRKLNVSEAYLRPGFAFGGSCLPKDLRALLHAAHVEEVSLPVLSAVLPSNDGQVRRGVDAVLATRKRRVGVVGLAFKPGTDDLRESPMVTLIEALIGKGCDVRILDRNVSIARLVGANRRYIEEEIPHIASLMCESVEVLLAHAEVLVVAMPTEEATQALAGTGPDHIVIDLTRGGLQTPLRLRRAA
jgi:GDP-mannose 6-dehydrogenase